MRLALAILTLALTAAAAPPLPWDWSREDLSYLGGPRGFEESRAICARVIRAEPPAADRPTPAQAQALKGCDSEALYYGIGRPADPTQARLCAFTEKDNEIGEFGGRAMLMTIYANGKGAARNLDVATHLACGLEGAPAEVDGRVRHLAALRAGEEFHVCDDITSGRMMGVCSAHQARIAGARRDLALSRLATQGGFAGAADWTALRKAMEAYADARGSGEIDLSGTARGMFVTVAEERVRDDFLATLTALAGNKVPAAGPAALTRTDAELNRTYQAALKALEPNSFPGSVTREGMRSSALAWIRYRDAMLAFAARRFPATPRSALATMLTKQHIADLTAEQ